MPAAGLGQPAGSLMRAYRGMIQVGLANSGIQGRGALARLCQTREAVAALSWSTRKLALLTRFRGAKRGANDHRSGAASGHIQPLLVRPIGTSGDIRPLLATLQKCLLSSRSRVRVAVGAQIMQVVLNIRKDCHSNELLLAGSHSYLMYRQAGTRSPGKTVIPDIRRRSSAMIST
jgi:hypothetical protein